VSLQGYEFTTADGTRVRVGAPAAIPGYTEVELIQDGRVTPSYRVTAQLYRRVELETAVAGPLRRTRDRSPRPGGSVPDTEGGHTMARKTSTTSKPKPAAKPRTAPKKAEPRETPELLRDPAAMLSEYLLAEASEDKIGTANLPAPYVTDEGRVFVHTRSVLKWAQGRDKAISKDDVSKALRDLGLKGPAVRPLPGKGVNVAFRSAVKPKGVKLQDVARRAKKAAPAQANGKQAEAQPEAEAEAVVEATASE
jgi:hypothetical protein